MAQNADNSNSEQTRIENQNMVRSCPAAPNTDSDVIKYFRSIPVGYKFNPTDEELIGAYLMRKVNDQPLPPNLIHVVDVYGQHPSEITRRYKLCSGRMTEWYFFTSRQKKYPKGQRPDRAIGNGIGFWKATGRDQKISKNDQPIGTRRSLDFFEGRHPHGDKTKWKMHEFVIHDSCIQIQRPRSGMTLDDWVLCKIYQTRVGKRNENGHDDDDTSPNGNIPMQTADFTNNSVSADQNLYAAQIDPMAQQGNNAIQTADVTNNSVSADQQVVDGAVAQQDSTWTILPPMAQQGTNAIQTADFNNNIVSADQNLYAAQFDYGAQQGTNAIQTADFNNNIVSADQNLYAAQFDYGAQQGTNAIQTADFNNNFVSADQQVVDGAVAQQDSRWTILPPMEQQGTNAIQTADFTNNIVSADQQVVDGAVAQQDSTWTILPPMAQQGTNAFTNNIVSADQNLYAPQFDYGAQQGTNAIQTAGFNNNIVSADQNLYASNTNWQWGFDYGAPLMPQQGTNAIQTAGFNNNIAYEDVNQYFDASCLFPPASEFSGPCFGLNPTEQLGPGNIQQLVKEATSVAGNNDNNVGQVQDSSPAMH